MIGRLDYEERKEARIERLEEKATKAKEKSMKQYQNMRRISENIPFGQPILIGHHSEKHARRDAERMDNYMRKSHEEQEKSKYYKQKAESAKSNMSISSDNPKAIELLEQKITELKAEQSDLKEQNKYYKKHKTMSGYPGMSEEQAKEIDERIERAYSFNKKPAPSYVLTNLNARIKNTELRLEKLKIVDCMEDETLEWEGFKIRSNSETNRIEIYFNEKPDEEVREKLKRNGFRWARSIGAWQRLRTPQALRIAKQLLTEDLC